MLRAKCTDCRLPLTPNSGIYMDRLSEIMSDLFDVEAWLMPRVGRKFNKGNLGRRSCLDDGNHKPSTEGIFARVITNPPSGLAAPETLACIWNHHPKSII